MFELAAQPPPPQPQHAVASSDLPGVQVCVASRESIASNILVMDFMVCSFLEKTRFNPGFSALFPDFA